MCNAEIALGIDAGITLSAIRTISWRWPAGLPSLNTYTHAPIL